MLKEIENIPDEVLVVHHLQDLNEKLRLASHAYYNESESLISDAEYDELFHGLRKYLEEFPQYIDKIPGLVTLGVGAPVMNTFPTVTHRHPMISLDNVFNEAEMSSWLNNGLRHFVNLYDIELKFDGLAVSLFYDDGELVRAATRGDGLVGEDITENVKTIKNVPTHIRANGHTEIRGEIIITKSAFKKINERLIADGRKPFANPRNAAAGSVRMISPVDVSRRPLMFVPYELVESEQEFTTHSQAMQWLHELGFHKPSFWGETNSEKGILLAYEKMIEDRNDLNYPIDGLVIKADAYAARARLGENMRVPYWAIAFKFPPDSASAIVHDVQWQVGRTGKITPVAIFKEPVQICGVMIQRCTLNNASEVQRLDLRYDDMVTVERSGDVIPKITHVWGGNVFRRPIDIPSRCPCCDHELSRRKDGGIHLYCINAKCPAVTLRQLEYWVSREVMNIQGVGESILEILQQYALVNNLADLYHLCHYRDKMFEIEGFAEDSINRILSSIDASRNPPIDRFIMGLGINGLANVTAKQIAKHVTSVEDFVKGSLDAPTAKALYGIGDVVAESLAEFVNANYDYIMDLEELVGGTRSIATELKSAGLEGLTFCITGTFPNFSRDDIKAEIESHGGIIVNNVTRKTRYLVCGTNAGSKLTKAQELSTPILENNWVVELMSGNYAI